MSQEQPRLSPIPESRASAGSAGEVVTTRVALAWPPSQKGRLEEARKLQETRVATARMAYERSMQELAMEREALQEARKEAVAA